MKKFFVFFFVLLCCTAASGAEKGNGKEGFILCKNAQVCVAVVSPGKKTDRWAKEFAFYMSQCIGKPIPVRKDPDPGKNNIVLTFVEQPVEDDSFTIDFPDRKTLRISGNSSSIKAATIYILEQYFSVRILMRYPRFAKRVKGYESDLEYVFPKAVHVSIPRKKIRIAPSVHLKRYFSSNLYYDWYLRNHTFYGIHGITESAYPAGKYAPDNSWPKEILPVIRGRKYRMPEFNPKAKNPYRQYNAHWNPCWSNPASARIAIANIDEMMTKESNHPVFGKRHHVELTINDNGGCCECEKCRKAVRGRINSIRRADYSELYWKWIKDIADGLSQKHPSLYIVASAYRETFDPPSFRLPDNVIVQLCRELLIGSIDPARKPQIEKNFKDWNTKAKTLFLYDYYENNAYPRGGYVYVLPRVHLHSYADMFKIAYKHGVRGVYLESNHNLPMTGPSLYLISRLYWDIHTDLDWHFKDWCIHAVGKKAAPFLMEYYLAWERYWLRPEMRKTKWGMSSGGTYLPLGEGGSYTYLLTVKDMEHFASLMEKVVRYAETPKQKRRALLFRRLFKMSENAVKCLHSVYLLPDGSVKDVETAVAMVRAIPDAVKALEELKKEPFVTKNFLDVVQTGLCNLRGIVPYSKDPRMQKALKELARLKGLPPALKGMCSLLTGVKYKNLLENGSFEKGLNPSWLLRKNAVRDSKFVSDGKYSLKARNGALRIVKEGITPEKTYMLLFDVHAPHTGGEGRMDIQMVPRAGLKHCQFIRFRDYRVSQGWQTFSNAFKVIRSKAGVPDNILIQFSWNFFEKNEFLRIDNIRLYQLD